MIVLYMGIRKLDRVTFLCAYSLRLCGFARIKAGGVERGCPVHLILTFLYHGEPPHAARDPPRKGDTFLEIDLDFFLSAMSQIAHAPSDVSEPCSMPYKAGKPPGIFVAKRRKTGVRGCAVPQITS